MGILVPLHDGFTEIVPVPTGVVPVPNKTQHSAITDLHRFSNALYRVVIVTQGLRVQPLPSSVDPIRTAMRDLFMAVAGFYVEYPDVSMSDEARQILLDLRRHGRSTAERSAILPMLAKAMNFFLAEAALDGNVAHAVDVAQATLCDFGFYCLLKENRN